MHEHDGGADGPRGRDAMDRAWGLAAADDAQALARVRRRLQAVVCEAGAALVTVPGTDEGWTPVAQGVAEKLLWEADGMRSVMLRLAPGAVFPSHVHALPEECVVLEGTLRIGSGIHLRKGDYHRAMPGAAHDVAVSDEGALVFLRAAA